MQAYQRTSPHSGSTLGSGRSAMHGPRPAPCWRSGRMQPCNTPSRILSASPSSDPLQSPSSTVATVSSPDPAQAAPRPNRIAQLAKKVAIFVEPSPFSHISGMKNRFECLIKGLREAGDQVVVVTPDPQPPQEFCGAKVKQPGSPCVKPCCASCRLQAIVSTLAHLCIACAFPANCSAQVVNVLGFKLPFYSSPTLLLSSGLSIRVLYYLIKLKPEVIHVSSPGAAADYLQHP